MNMKKLVLVSTTALTALFAGCTGITQEQADARYLTQQGADSTYAYQSKMDEVIDVLNSHSKQLKLQVDINKGNNERDSVMSDQIDIINKQLCGELPIEKCVPAKTSHKQAKKQVKKEEAQAVQAIEQKPDSLPPKREFQLPSLPPRHRTVVVKQREIIDIPHKSAIIPPMYYPPMQVCMVNSWSGFWGLPIGSIGCMNGLYYQRTQYGGCYGRMENGQFIRNTQKPSFCQGPDGRPMYRNGKQMNNSGGYNNNQNINSNNIQYNHGQNGDYSNSGNHGKNGNGSNGGGADNPTPSVNSQKQYPQQLKRY